VNENQQVELNEIFTQVTILYSVPWVMSHPKRRQLCFAAVVFLLGLALSGCDQSELQPRHTHNLSKEYDVGKKAEVQDLDAYLALEDALFLQLDEEIYAHSPSGAEYSLLRYVRRSMREATRSWGGICPATVPRHRE
jgi:hypothetical protein